MHEVLTARGRALLMSAGTILSVEPVRIVHPRPKSRAKKVWWERWKREREVKLAFGQCSHTGCRCLAQAGRKMCEGHLSSQREYQRRSRANRGVGIKSMLDTSPSL